jgi:photosystem II stability/assembly factor-like uncharacterized protein
MTQEEINMTQYVYAGAGRWTSASDDEQPGGLMRTEVGSGEWHMLSQGLPPKAEVRSILIHPDNPEIIFAGTHDGPYRSTNQGESWEKLDFPDPGMVVWCMIFHPEDSQVIYLGTAPAAVYRSDNGGDSWKRLSIVETCGSVNMGFPMRVIRLTIDPSQPKHVYAGLEVGGVIRSTDGGETWTDCTEDLLRLASMEHLTSQIGSDTDIEGMMDSHAITVSASQPGTVFLATRMGLFRSPDQGDTWSDMQVGRFSPLTYARDVQVSPQNPNVLYAALSPAARSRDGSLYRSDNLGESWTRFDHDVTPESTMMTIALNRQDDQVVYCATRGGQVFGTQDGGASWQETPLPEGLQDIYTLACG